MCDQPSTPADRIRFWVDYVARHGGAKQFHSDGVRRLNWFQYWCMDVGVFLLAAVLLLISLVCLLLRLTVSVVGSVVLKAFHGRLDDDCNR